MQGSAVFANYEGTGVGINASTAGVIYQEYSFNIALCMLAFDFVLFFGLGFYMDKVLPSSFGQRSHPCFPCMPSYYRCCRKGRQRGNTNNAVEDEAQLLGDNQADIFESEQMPSENYEPAPIMCKRLEAAGDYLCV